MLHDRDHILTLLAEAYLARASGGYSLGTAVSLAEQALQGFERAILRPPKSICRTCGTSLCPDPITLPGTDY
jgi:hypothetical protein